MNTDAVLPVLFELLAKSVLISLAAALLTRAWRGATAAQRHLVWLVALATIMMLPTTRLVAPFWKIPLAPVKQITVVRAALPNAHLDPIEVDSSAMETMAPSPVRVALDWRKILLGIWLGGAVLLLARRLSGSWRLHRLMRRSTPLDDPRTRLLLSRTLSELDLHRRPEIRLSKECRVPLTWGSLRPVMLLPKDALQWNDTWLTAALRHEAAHIRRCDYLTRWFAHVACAIYWPNPLVWLLARSLRVAQELAADDLVLRAGTPPEEYASQLVDAARAVTTHGFFVRQAVAMACPSTLEDRVRAIVDGDRDRRPLSRLAAACGSLTIALMFALSTAAQLRSDEQKPVPAEKASASAPRVKFGPEIEIDAKFIVLDPAEPSDPITQPKNPTIYSDPQFQVIMRALGQKKGVDLLSSPRVTTRANQRAVLEIIREFRFPTEWEKDGRIWKPTKFETKNIGTTLNVEPRIQEDGAIQLHATASVVEVLGIVDLDTGKATLTPGAQSEVTPLEPGHRIRYVFSERKRDGAFTLHSEETVGISALPEISDVKPFEKNASRRNVLVFISPRILAAAPAPDASKDGAAATAAPAGSSTVLRVDKAGKVTFNGEPISTDDLKTRLQALKATSLGSPDVILRGDADTPYKTIMDVLEIVQSAGITNAAFVHPTSKEGAAAASPPTTSITDQNTITFKNSTGAAPSTANTLTVNGTTTFSNGGTLDIPGGDANSAKAPEGLVTREWKIPRGMILSESGAADVSAKDWLISKGVRFDAAATATYIPDTGRLIVRNSPEQLDIVDKIVRTTGEDAFQAPAAGSKQSDLTINSAGTLTFRGEVQTAAAPGATPGIIHLNGGTLVYSKDGKSADGTLVSASTLNISGGTALISKDGTVDGGTVNGPTTPTGNGRKTPEGADGPALAKAKKIIIPKIELREVSFEEALEFLRKKAVEFDPDKTGVKMVVKPGTVSEAKMTLSLVNVPLIEALKYVTSLANLEFVATPDALVVQPAGAGKSGARETPKGAAAIAQATQVLRKAYETLNETEKWEEKLQTEAAKAGRPVPQFPPKSELQKSILGEKNEAADMFLHAYLIATESEKLEQDQQFQEAFIKMQAAGEMFDKITALDPAWQPQIMDYRKRRVAEALRRLQSKL